MPTLKYFEKIERAIAKDAHYPDGTLPPFDFNSLAPKGFIGKMISKNLHPMVKIIYRGARKFFPIFSFRGFTHVVSAQEVKQVLNRPEDFQVPFGPEMHELADGATFVLGLEGAEQERQNALIRKIIIPSDSAKIIALTHKFGSALLENSAGEIDAMNDYLKRVVSEVCIRYFGFSTDQSDDFADWTISASALLFADPYGDPKIRELSLNGAYRIRALIDDSVARIKNVMPRKYNGGVSDALLSSNDFIAAPLIERLLILQELQKDKDPISHEEIRAILFGLVTGFIPTNGLAAGKILEELVRRPAALKLAKEAAQKNDRDSLRKIILEAGRLNPALSPGQWRYCPKDTQIDTGHGSKKIKAGTILLVSTMSAMRDRKAFPKPYEFWPDRVNKLGQYVEPDLIFGSGVHECIGKYLATEQITESLRILLSQDKIKPMRGAAGKMQSIGIFPRHLMMRYDSPSSAQSMFIILADVDEHIDKESADIILSEFGNPSNAEMQSAFDRTDIVHFSSLSTIETEKGLKLSFELSVDGHVDNAIALIAHHAEKQLRSVFAMTGLKSEDDLAEYMRNHIVNLHGKPWGATGLNYNGLSEFPIQKVKKQDRFADFAGRVLRDYVTTETARGSHPSLILSYFRKILRQDPSLKMEATASQIALMQEAEREGFDAFYLTTQKMRIKLTQYREKSHLENMIGFLKSQDFKPYLWTFLLVWLAKSLLFWPSFTGAFLAKILIVPIMALLSTIVSIAIIFGIFIVLLRAHESRDKPYEHEAPLLKLRSIMEGENHPGYEQNHVMAVGKLKSGLFRKYLHALSLWSIGIAVKHWFRPGLVNHMGSIHYARWWRIPGSDTVSFYSNFDGSWENYLEDFIMRNRWGQTAGWSNWEGFPNTKYLIMGGAGNAEGFKRWVRIVQQIAPFWYSRFPEFTTERIRNNAIIHLGSGLAETSTEAEEWLRCFGSMPRTENHIQSDEVQALIFRGMKNLPYSKCLALKLPQDSSYLGEWLCWIRGRAMRSEGMVPKGNEAALKILLDENILVKVPRPEGQEDEYALAHSMSIAFGDRPLSGATMQDNLTKHDCPAKHDAQAAMSQAAIFGLSAAGVAKFDTANEDILKSGFPDSFQMGMAARSRILGDADMNDPKHWRWNDDIRNDDATEAVLMLYADNEVSLDKMMQAHSILLENHGGAIISKIDCAPAWQESDKADFEHFGYRDGISQPIIKGSSRSTKNTPERDILETGEFIIGYPDSMGYYPASPLLPQEADLGRALPIKIDDNLSKFPDFGDEKFVDAPRDLGRNGSFLVIRELKQDVEGFEDFVTSAAEDLTDGGLSDLYKVVGQNPDKEWVKAKLMGRWTNGRPMISNPVFKNSDADTLRAETKNDFSYGDDDPHGIACPFGSHIRRTNPRDSKLPGDKGAKEISNRHRILRRGRSYTNAKTNEKGLLFACFCTDINRQFEFVQQFWSNAPSFHGLRDEPDPIIGACPIAKDGTAKERLYTIPTAAGPVQIKGLRNFVQMMGGGYFFVPSKSALSWMSDRALHHRSKRKSS